MKPANFAVLMSATLLLSAFTLHQSINWQIASGYAIKFTSKDPSGVFTKMSGDVSFDANALDAAKFDVKVDVASINTGNGMQNGHAKSEKWFNAKKYPTISFVSSKFSKTATGYEVAGTLDMHGVKKEITMPFTFANNVFKGSFTVNRLDYNIGDTKGMSAKVPAELKLDISVPVTKK